MTSTSGTTTAVRARAITLPSILFTATGAFALALSAQVRVPIPGTPVPVTLQTYMVLVLGGLLGARLGVSATLAYLALGLIGVPWFATVTLGPTLGYLVGFIAATYWVGKAKTVNAAPLFFRMLGGQALIYLCGVAVLSLFVGTPHAFAAGVLPFAISDFLKVVAATLTVQLFKKVKVASS